MWTLSRIFPIIVAELLKNDPHYLNFLEIDDIFRYLMKESFDLDGLEYLRNKIGNYLNNFKYLYKDEKIIPKEHFLIHYPTMIKKFGPPKLYWTMRFESKHSYYKRVNTANHNHVNLLYSLANRQ